MSWHRRSGRPDPVPADPLQLALDGSLVVALPRALVTRALRGLEAERARLVAERRAWPPPGRSCWPGGETGRSSRPAQERAPPGRRPVP